MLTIYNTLTRKKEGFVPLEAGKVSMYVCGPTVYDFFHIGNARSFITSDMIRRYLEFRGFTVAFVMNITDVDDKIINRANEQGVPASSVAEEYTRHFLEDIGKLGIQRATVNPKATEHIPEIIAMIEKMVVNGSAYAANGDVYFEISKFPAYGKLSGKHLADLEAGARVDVNEQKKSPLDFALWKAAKPGEPSWDSPWGKGRPGWHIECSAMSCKHLGETFDIHCGGSDLIFPHHENEIAQSEAANGKQFVRYWMHFGFLNIDNEKMSKSLGNFFTARDILQKFSAETLRMFYAQTHYASPLNFTAEALDAAAKGLEKFSNFLDRVRQARDKATPGAPAAAFDVDSYYRRFTEAMDDDFNTPQGLAVLFDFIRDANRALSSTEAHRPDFLDAAERFIAETAGGVLGLLPKGREEGGSELTASLIELLIRMRTQAKLDKNFALADRIRDELKTLGITLQDSKEKTTWKIG